MSRLSKSQQKGRPNVIIVTFILDFLCYSHKHWLGCLPWFTCGSIKRSF